MSRPSANNKQCPRDPWSDLHTTALTGCTSSVVALLARLPITEIDRVDPKGHTPLMLAAGGGHARIVQILLDKGANPSVVDDTGFTAMLVAAAQGHLAVINILVQVGEDLEQVDPDGHTPLHLAALGGNTETVKVLLEAGANPNNRLTDGRTPMFGAAQDGHVDTIRELLRAKADPSLGFVDSSGLTFVPLDAAAERMQSAVVDMLIQELGIEGCGGASGGKKALEVAAQEGALDILVALTNEGVVDTGAALSNGVANGNEACVRFLLRLQNASGSSMDVSSIFYVNNTCGPKGAPPLVNCVVSCFGCAPRILRMLMDAGADAKSAVPLLNRDGVLISHETPLDILDICISDARVRRKDATREQLSVMKGMRRLLLQAETVHAVSWLWHSSGVLAPSDATRMTGPPLASRPLTRMLPIIRQRAGRRRVALASLFRFSRKS